MDDSRIYLGVVCGRRNGGGCLLEDIWRNKIFLQKFQPLCLYSLLKIFRLNIDPYMQIDLSDLDIFIILRST